MTRLTPKPINVPEAKNVATQLLKDARAAEELGDTDRARVCRNVMDLVLDKANLKAWARQRGATRQTLEHKTRPRI